MRNGRIPVLQVGDALPARKQRGLLVSRRGQLADPGRPLRPRRHAALDVLRTIQPRTQRRDAALLARVRRRSQLAREQQRAQIPGQAHGRRGRAGADGRAPRRARLVRRRGAARSPTSRSMPTPMWPRTAGSACAIYPACLRLARAGRARCPDSSRWIDPNGHRCRRTDPETVNPLSQFAAIGWRRTTRGQFHVPGDSKTDSSATTAADDRPPSPASHRRSPGLRSLRSRGGAGSARSGFRDVHLGTRGCNAEMLIDFLDHVDSETMYLVGDIIDGWRLKKKFYWPAAHNDVVWRILKRAKRGTRIVYIPGNHDEMFRQFTGLEFRRRRDPAQGDPRHRRRPPAAGAARRRIRRDHAGAPLARASSATRLRRSLMALNRWVNAVRRRFDLPYWSLSKHRQAKVKNAVEFISQL